MNPSTPLLPWWSPLVGTMRLVSLLSAVSAGCAHGLPAEMDNYEKDREADSAAAICENPSCPSSTDGSCPETDLPRTMTSPLECTTPKMSPGGQALCLQCALKPGVKADSVLLHYRKSSEESFHSLPMRRAADGWFRVTIPALVMSGCALYVFYDALDSVARVATDGQSDSPSVIPICRGRK